MTTDTNDLGPSEDTAPPPPRTSRRSWWIVGAVLVAAVITIVLVAGNSGKSLTTDRTLESALLTGEDFPTGYTAAVMSEAELNKATSTDSELPDEIQPAQCAQLLKSQPKPTGNYTVGAVMASNASTNTYYIEMITPVGGLEEWDARQIDEVLSNCGTTTFTEDGQTGTVTFQRIAIPPTVDRSFALRTGISAGGVELTIGVAVSRVDEHVVVLVGGTSGKFDEAEFVGLTTAANDRARETLGRAPTA